MTHTPGPWRVAKTGDLRPAVYGRSERNPICVLQMDRGENGGKKLPNADANARLIAAAPDLLAALRLHDEIAKLDEKYGDDAVWTDEWCDAVKAGRAAIAKATGEP